MSASLFRQEAIDYQRRRAWAGSSMAPPPGAWMLSGLMAGSLAAALFFLACGSYARKEAVTGFLEPAGGIARVSPPVSGVIASVAVQEGQAVLAGQRLLALSTERRASDGEPLDAAIVERLAAKRREIAARLVGERATTGVQARALEDLVAGLDAEAEALRQSLFMQQERRRVAHEQVEAVRGTAARGLTTMTEFRRRQDDELSQIQSVLTLERQIAAKRVEAQEKRHALAELAARSADRLGQLQVQLDEADAAQAEAASRLGYVVVAPVAGRVTSLQARPGMSAVAGMPVLAIVPEPAELLVSLQVPARAVGFLRPGQDVRVAFDAFPAQRYGYHQATIGTISQAVLKPAEQSGPMAGKEPAYLVTARLARQTVTAYGQEMALRPDMGLRANIIVDRRSLLAWIFDPLLSMRGRH